MAKIVVTINTDSAAFDNEGDTGYMHEASEVARILRQYANEVTDKHIVSERKLLDINGNTVGEVRVYESVESTAAKDQTSTV